MLYDFFILDKLYILSPNTKPTQNIMYIYVLKKHHLVANDL